MIFNSLGSNYDFLYVAKSLFSFPKRSDSLKLKNYLEKKYEGHAILLYKNREAVKLALEISDLPKGSKVGINGFTCFVVNQAIVEAGYIPVYLDIRNTDMNFDIKNLEKVKDIKALIIQNTFGCPHDITQIKSYCDKNGILIIEDLAHSVGSIYPNGKEVGTVGDFVALSFSQDKSIDAVSGGALIVRNKKFVNGVNDTKTLRTPIANQIRDRFYPLLTYVIRKLYPLGLGRMFHYVIKKLKILSDPMGNLSHIKYHALPNWNAYLARLQFDNSNYRVRHRRGIAEVYINNLDEGLLSSGVVKNCNLSSNIRFPIFVENRIGLINFLKKNGVFVSDIWYDAPVAPKKLINRTDYKKGMCKNAEVDAEIILNLPTHININKKDAERISAIINKWISTNQN